MDVAVLVLLDITFRALNWFTVYLLFSIIAVEPFLCFIFHLPQLYVFPPRARI